MKGVCFFLLMEKCAVKAARGGGGVSWWRIGKRFMQVLKKKKKNLSKQSQEVQMKIYNFCVVKIERKMKVIKKKKCMWLFKFFF